MTSVAKLVEKLRANGIVIPADWRFMRVRPGRRQRARGAWSWNIVGTACNIGSQYSVRECLRARRLVIDQYGYIDPEK